MRPDSDDVRVTVERLIAARAAGLAQYGSGETAARWRTLREISADDVVFGRLFEAHVDAVSILHETGGPAVEKGQWWGVWAAEALDAPLLLTERADGSFVLDGVKAWCSGAGLCTHALVTARSAAAPGQRLLCAVALPQERGDEGREASLRIDTQSWRAAGMMRSRTYSVCFDGVVPQWVVPADRYLQRAGFWHGAIGVAACWLGGAFAVARTLRERATGPARAHRLAHLGAVDSALSCAVWAMDAAARELDEAPDDIDAARIRALRLRLLVGHVASDVIDRVGRALGAAPLCLDAQHAQVVADLSVYVRQCHAEVDAATLGEMVESERHAASVR